MVLGGAPILLYDYWIAQVDPVLAGWNAQNITLTPALWDVLMALSPAILFGACGVWISLRYNLRQARLLITWLVAGLFAIYLPFDLQRRFMMGLFIPAAALAGVFLSWLRFDRKPPWKHAHYLQAVVLILSVLTNGMVLLAIFFGTFKHDPLYYLTAEESDALAWIASNTARDAIVLASPEIGTVLPAVTGRRVIYGHPFETVNGEQEKAGVLAFFHGCNSCDAGLERAAYLLDRKVNYLFFGPREQGLGLLEDELSLLGSQAPGASLKPVYSEGGVIIYEVGPP